MAGNNRRYIANQGPPPEPEQIPDDGDIATLLNKTILILNREIKHLMGESAHGKLNTGSARDLVNYTKLLSELHKEEKELMDNLTDEDLRDIMESRKNDKA